MILNLFDTCGLWALEVDPTNLVCIWSIYQLCACQNGFICVQVWYIFAISGNLGLTFQISVIHMFKIRLLISLYRLPCLQEIIYKHHGVHLLPRLLQAKIQCSRALVYPQSSLLPWSTGVHHLIPNGTVLLSAFISFDENFMGVQLHWAFFCWCFSVWDWKVAGTPLIKLMEGSPFFHVDPPSSVSEWKKWFYIHGDNAPTFSHNFLTYP